MKKVGRAPGGPVGRKYFVTLDGSDIRGPYSKVQLKIMYSNGTLTANAFCCPDGEDDWQPIDDVVGAHVPVTASTRSKGTYVALAICLGWLGIHHFYAGRYGSGALLLGLSILGIVLIPIGLGAFMLVGIWVCGVFDAILCKCDATGAPFKM